uniref:Uncharacterized protein n=1 Tax=Aplanochytrium stocchinoi TaxID=215587 RepID=A0A7S3LPC0_9STRA|eukprot:CAMPEP_0204832910 /NCGR_PEP_ID=MMETSP1346-20131115/15099_1 /ASSEMBLY_ACC=CAM_ASM_000771 /TAXON_ID=215587 /ORGANISM="Aplanochytrium stocchinoi, Strain GSBS06" /LENGTH=191 /DNA_ID=CAMNT_0051965027 /DNA_START=109 /DNA_END=684 /DNA_ORIENTATION=-
MCSSLQTNVESCLVLFEKSVSDLENSVSYFQANQYSESTASNSKAEATLNVIFGSYDDACEQLETCKRLCSAKNLKILVEAAKENLQGNDKLLNQIEDLSKQKFDAFSPMEKKKQQEQKADLQTNSRFGSSDTHEYSSEANYFPTPKIVPRSRGDMKSPIKPFVLSPADSDPPTPSLEDFGLSNKYSGSLS